MNDIVCISPVDGSVVARRRIATDPEIAEALAAARQAQREWSRVPLAERKAKVLAFLEIIRAQNDEIVPELAMQMGRPVRYGGELRSLEERVRTLVELSDEALAPTTPAERPGFRRMIKRVPAGVVLVIAPWNYPYLTAVNAVVPALLSGNAVILKHATQTLLVGERFQSAMDQAGLPKNLFTTLNLDHGAAEKLITSGLLTMSTSPVRLPAAVRSNGPRPVPSQRSALNWAVKIRLTSDQTRTLILRWNSSSMERSTIPASAAAASSASTSTSRSMIALWTRSPI